MRLAKKFVGRQANESVTVVFDALFTRLHKQLVHATRSTQRFGSLAVFAGGIHSSASVLQSNEFDWHFHPACVPCRLTTFG
jgi:hypothetical protein